MHGSELQPKDWFAAAAQAVAAIVTVLGALAATRLQGAQSRAQKLEEEAAERKAFLNRVNFDVDLLARRITAFSTEARARLGELETAAALEPSNEPSSTLDDHVRSRLYLLVEQGAIRIPQSVTDLATQQRYLFPSSIDGLSEAVEAIADLDARLTVVGRLSTSYSAKSAMEALNRLHEASNRAQNLIGAISIVGGGHAGPGLRLGGS